MLMKMCVLQGIWCVDEDVFVLQSIWCVDIDVFCFAGHLVC